jgi:NAD(P)H-hydrate repair Nnr-like enzyme with NAD(P)H-hydrate dehydratase domain
MQFGHGGVTVEGARERVLPRAGAKDQDAHNASGYRAVGGGGDGRDVLSGMVSCLPAWGRQPGGRG